MDLLTVTLAKGDTLLSVPVGQIQGLGEAAQDQLGYIVLASGRIVHVNEDYGTLVSMWRDLTGTGDES